MKEVIIVKKEFFELTKSEKKSLLRLFIGWAIKKYFKTYKNK